MSTKAIQKVLAAAAIAATASGAFARDDQVWLKFAAEGSPFKSGHVANPKDETGKSAWQAGWLENVEFKLEQEFKYDNSRLIDEETLMLIGYKFCPWFSAFVGHRVVRERKSGQGPLQTEQRQTTDLCFTVPEFWKLKVDFRSRFELRDKHHAQAYMRYRERIRLRTSWKATKLDISPYCSEELFFSDKPKQDHADLFDRSRAQLGLTFRPIPALKDLSCNLYFMVQHDMSSKSSTWDPTNVYGLDLTCKF